MQRKFGFFVVGLVACGGKVFVDGTSSSETGGTGGHGGSTSTSTSMLSTGGRATAMSSTSSGSTHTTPAQCVAVGFVAIGASCSIEGASCAMPAACCGARAVCTDGKWTTTEPPCGSPCLPCGGQLACAADAVCVVNERRTDQTYLCAPNPCIDVLTCDCAQLLCDASSLQCAAVSDSTVACGCPAC